MRSLLLIAAAATLITGCASTDTGYAGTRAQKDNATTTGTRLPPRNTDGVKAITKDDFESDRKRLPEGIKAPGT